ncbi:MAG: hypothetical protein PHH54_00695 [Candidatus Nanoarchaeia archaeon]|nr:hypothetical protein [Candidatus Nanoarchaeia archaeon]MDD5740480.1 hypothetical protein [Candidatus Nanoarchaeia archaeon]
MVITPQEAKALTKADKALLKGLEKRIDQALLEGENTFDINEYPGEKVVQEITHIYEKAGWEVSYESDQREGNYLSFKEMKTGGRE